MSQNLIIDIKGLSTNQNQLSKVSPGNLQIAKNISVDRMGVAESRRGFNYLELPPTSAARVDRITEYQDKKITRRSDNDTLAYYTDAVGWTYYSGTYLNPDSDYARMRFLKTSGNLYFTTSLGIYALYAVAGPIYSAGMPKGLDGSGSTTGASGFMDTNTQVAYRIVWGSKDVNNNLYLGAASQRIIVSNTAGATRDVALVFTIPSGIAVTDFYQIYRSKASASSTDEPNDELQLVYETNPSAGQITALQVTVTDSTPFSLAGASLYSNSSQQGVSESNDIPPVAKDIELFKNFTFFGNIKTKYKLFISLLSVSGTGLVNNDTITINSIVFTGKTAGETIASGYFKVFTSGSAAQNIEDTAKSLVKVVNQYASNTTIYAYYLSGYQDLPGQILLETRSIGSSSFSVSTSRAAAFDLDDGVSDNEEYINGIMWSKADQPEHVPSSHLALVGSKNFNIRRIIALRDSLFILKDDGVFRLTGSGGSWSIDPLDTSTKIIAPDSAVVINNQIFCLSDQGIVSISDLGVEIKSFPISDKITNIISSNYLGLKKESFGIAYETEHKYILFTVNAISDNSPTQAFVYNSITDAWTTWEKDVTHGFVSSVDDKLYLCASDSEQVFQERKSLTYTDFADETLTGFNITSFTGTSVVIDTIVNIEVGDVLWQSSTILSIITAINAGTNTLTMTSTIAWSVAAASILKAIPCELEFINMAADNAGSSKHFQEIAWLFREKSFSTALTSFYTDLSGGYSDTTMTGTYGTNVWGSFTWGLIPWGGISRPKPIRVFVAREKSRGSLLSVRLKVNNAYSRWSLNGLSLQFDFVSERMTRE